MSSSKGKRASDDASGDFTLASPAFHDSQKIPSRYSGEGRDVSPPLRWTGVPSGTRELALLCEDPDAPQSEPWVHWIAYKIPRDRTDLPEDLPPEGEVRDPIHLYQGVNSFDRVGYGGPMPPKRHGAHRYYFKHFALDTELADRPGLDKASFLERIDGHVLASAELMGTYER